MEKQNERIIDVIEKEIREALRNPGDVVMKVRNITFTGRVIEADIHVLIDGEERKPLSIDDRPACDEKVGTPKRKYTKRIQNSIPALSIKHMRREIRTWDQLGYLSENEAKAIMDLSSVSANKLSDAQKAQIASIHQSAAKKAKEAGE